LLQISGIFTAKDKLGSSVQLADISSSAVQNKNDLRFLINNF
jgi:hypothetical protein